MSPKICFNGDVFILKYSVCFIDATVKSWRNNWCVYLRHIQRNVTWGQHEENDHSIRLCLRAREGMLLMVSTALKKNPNNNLESSQRAKALYPGTNQCLSWLTPVRLPGGRIDVEEEQGVPESIPFLPRLLLLPPHLSQFLKWGGVGILCKQK